ncbi:uncharacterized protein LOC117146848 [Drosophila mauritiana]|uniref:Uncharacterized protein LOC117146848 n=1 Tax=Drosophila mauritiana TaxID=7226 RepID=A0A6P8KZW4_DROMA|nr:uncharacterized protein LOC117146848 [Drosophila mauritiana]
MEIVAVGLAALLQLMGCYFFFAQPQDRCSAAPNLASWIFLGATFFFLWDTKIYPRRFMHMSGYWRILIEIVASVFLTELGTVIIWCSLEKFLFSLTNELVHLMQCSCRPSPSVYWLSGLITSSISGAVLWYVLEATDSMYYIRKFSCKLRTTLGVSWRMFRCYMQMNMKAKRRALTMCQLAKRARQCQMTPCEHSESDEYSSD